MKPSDAKVKSACDLHKMAAIFPFDMIKNFHINFIIKKIARFLNSRICHSREIRENLNLANMTRSPVLILAHSAIES